MVLVRTEAGQLALVPQQVLAQAKAQNQNKGTLSPRPATPTAGTTFRVTTPVAQVWARPVIWKYLRLLLYYNTVF